MAFRVEVGFKPQLFDARGQRTKHKIAHALPDLVIDKVRCFDVYNVDSANLEPAWAHEAFCDPVIQEMSINAPLSTDFDYYVEVGLRPGVTDNVGKSAAYALSLIAGQNMPVYASHAYLLKTACSRAEVEGLAGECLANGLIQHYRIFTPADIATITPYIPKVVGEHNPKLETIDLNISDVELVKLSQERTLALTLTEMQVIQAHFADAAVQAERAKLGLSAQITDVELEVLAQTWSEHCKHKIFAAEIEYEEDGQKETIKSLYKSYIQRSTKELRQEAGVNDICVSVFTDNAGVIKFDESHNLVFKVETHNSPSALDPYGGALTGIVGVNRDPFGTGLGAKLIFNTDVFCFADPFYSEELPPKILHPRRIFEGVREGVEHGGNKSGIPTVNGCIVFDNRYLGKPLVYCGTAGIMPTVVADRPSHEKKILPGDTIIMTGGRIGKDGIHGATFSSEELHEGSPVSAVQIGDPITQKKMFDFLLRARDKGLYRAITDNGAGGLSSSIGEMAELSGGCRIELDKPLLKYAGLQPWEILVSEAQERMSLAVAPENVAAFLELASEMDVEASVIGTFTDSGYLEATYEGKPVAYLNMDFMHKGLPALKLKAKWQAPEIEDIATPEPTDQLAKLKEMLGRLNICSKEYVVRQYDHEVQAGSVVKPLTGAENDGPSDAGVIRPLLDSEAGVVVSNGIVPRYSDIDTYHMTACALDEALRNYVCTGGNPDHWASLDNFCWCDPVESERNPDGQYKLAQLVRSNKALYDYTKAFNCPLVSGKDSMKNDYIGPSGKISIPPSLLISVIGKIDDVKQAVTMDAKQAGDIVYLLGDTKAELGGSEYLATCGLLGANVPQVDAASALARYRKLHAAIKQGLIASAHDLSDGGLIVALAEKAFAGGLGITAELETLKAPTDLTATELLYSESQSRILVTVKPANSAKLEELFGADAKRLGEVTAAPELIVSQAGQNVIKATLNELKQAWQATLDF